MGEDKLKMIEQFADYIIIEGTDRLGKYFRVRKLTQGYKEDLPQELISAQKVELIHKEKPYMKCQTCGAKIDTTTKIYVESKDVDSPEHLKTSNGYCKKHWRNQRIAEEL